MFKRTKISVGVLLALGSALSMQAMAQDAQRVEITGSSIKRIDAETALPVTTITRADIERTGATTAQDLVNLIPSNFGGGVVANNVGATGVASTANLRSLGPKYTLVLLNGRRIANYAFGNSPVDLNSIPLSAVERVEVLRDGASAIYGADAVAGVINFILKKDYQGIEGSVYATKTADGGGDTRSVNVTGGFGDIAKDRFNVVISANHEEDDVLKARDRSFASTANRPDLGINKASPRNGIPNLNFIDTNGNGYGTKGNTVAPSINPFRYNGCDNPAFALVVNGPSTCGTDYVKYIDLIPKQTHDNIIGRGVFQLNEDNQLYAEAVHVKDSMTSTYSPAPYTKTMTYPASGRFYPTTITIPKGTTLRGPYDKTNADGTITHIPGYKMPDGTYLTQDTVLGADLVVTPTGAISGTWRTVAGGGRTDITDTTTDRFLFGAKGTIAGWDYDTAITQSKNKGVISFGPGQFSYAKLTPLVASGEINVFGAQDATSLAALNSALITGPEQSATSTSTEFDARVSRDLFDLPAGPVGFAVGVSMRSEKLDQVSEPVLASGDQVGGAGPIPSVSGDRKVQGVFTELNIPVVKDLDLNLAARWDKYKNGFGTSFSNLSPKASVRYVPFKELLVRASYGQGYRAPTLYENLRPFTTGNNTNGNWSDPIRCPGGNPISSPNAVDADTECAVQLPTANKGESALKPEKSTQWSLGFAFAPSSNFNGSLDYWDVLIKDAIQPKSEIQVLSDPDKFKDFIYRYDPVNDPDQLNPIKGSQNPDFPIAYVYLPYENTAKFFASGLDINLQYKQKIENVGNLGFNVDATYYTRHGYQYAGDVVTSDLGKYKDFGPVPRLRASVTVALQSGPWAGSVTNNYSGGYQDYTDPNAINLTTYPAIRNVGAYSTWDSQVTWRGVKSLDLTFGIKNLLNTDPPSSRTSANFQTGYDASFTNPLGRTYYLRARYKFL